MGFGTGKGINRRSKGAEYVKKHQSNLTDQQKQTVLSIRNTKQKLKRDGESKKRVRDALKKYFDELTKIKISAQLESVPYHDRVSRIEKFISQRRNRNEYTLREFVTERYDTVLEWCYVCHRTLMTKQANILVKKSILASVPTKEKDEMPDKMICCHRCCVNMTKCNGESNVSAQAFWNKLDPGDIPECLKSLTSMEIRLIQRMIPFLKIVKFTGRWGQFGLQGQAVLFAQDVDEVFDILPRKPNEMGLFMVVECLKDMERQREMIINKARLQRGLEWLCEHNERYKDVKIDRKTLENFEIDYSQICVVAPPKNDKELWKKLNVPTISATSTIQALYAKRHALSECFNEHAGKQSLSMCIMYLIHARNKNINTWQISDVEKVLEEGHALHIKSTEQNGEVNFDSILRCFNVFDSSVEIAIINKVVFKQDKFRWNIENCLDNYGCGIIFANKVYLSIIKVHEEYYFFDCRPRGIKGYASKRNKTKNEYNGSAIVLRFNNFNQFNRRLMAQFGGNNGYTLVSILVSESTKEGLVSTFGDSTPSLHTNPLFKDTPEYQNSHIHIEDSHDNDLTNLTERLTLNSIWPLYASHCQADTRYPLTYRNQQCTAMSCAAIIKSELISLNNWTTQIMDEILFAGNELYIETCTELNEIRYIAAEEIVKSTKKFNCAVVLDIHWCDRLPLHANQLRTAVQMHFETNMKTNGILTSGGFSYAIIYKENYYWFFDSHGTTASAKAKLERTDLNGLMRILDSKINPSARVDISYVDVTFSNQNEFVIESRLEYIGEGKHALSEQEHPDTIVKKLKIENHGQSFDLFKTPVKDDFDEFIDETDGMSPYRQLYDTRNAKDEELFNRFIVTPWKNDSKSNASVEAYKRCLDFTEQEPQLTVVPEPAVIEDENNFFVTTADVTERNLKLAKLPKFDEAACIAAILNLNIDSFTGWSKGRLHTVLDEVEKILPSYEYNVDSLEIFGEKFNFEHFLSLSGETTELKELISTFFETHDYGLLWYNDKCYSISLANKHYCFFDPHSCNSKGYPSDDGTSCIMITSNFECLIEIIYDRLTHNDESLRVTMENKERFLLHAMQVEAINNSAMGLQESNLSSAIVIESSIQSTCFLETEHLCTAVAATATNFVNSFDNWNEDFMDMILKDGSNLCQHLKVNEVDIQNDFKMFSLGGLNIQTSVNTKLECKKSSLGETLDEFFKSYDSGIISVDEKFMTVMNKDGYYCLFDSHGANYYVQQHKACVIIVDALSQLVDLLLFRAPNEHSSFDIYSLQITMVNGMDFVNSITNMNHPKESKIDQILLDTPIICPTSLMRPIDNFIPKAEDLFKVNAEEKDINSEDVPLITITRATKPPLNHKVTKRFEEYCFPVLFPYGINGLNEEREIKMTPLQYFQSRVMGKDPRFHSKEYLLFALNYVENEKVASNISICGKMKQNHQNIQNVASNLHLVMRTIRGTSAYWANALLDLLAMVKVLGPGTAFLTLSCNDLNWDFMLKACLQAEGKGNVDPNTLTPQEKQHLVENNPVMVSRLFNREVQNMIKLLKNGQALDPWKVTDYWYRIEWQQRGSPHCHMIIWIKDFPKLNTPEGIQAMEQLCRCDIPNDDQDLANLVQRYQRHHCTQTCYKTRNKDNSSSKRCRFSFPRPVSKETRVLDPETTEFIKNGSRLVLMKREENAKFINNYNANILRIWQANMDLQFITSQAIIAYVAKYSCKSEPSSLHKLINEAIKEAQEKNEETKKTLFKVTMKILNERQVSCCEAATRLCHLPMKGCSRKVEFINSTYPEERYRMLKVQTDDPQSNSYYNNWIDRYENRPTSMNDLSLAEFVMEYKVHYHKKTDDVNEEDGDFEFLDVDEQASNKPIKLENGKGYIKKRAKSAIFRSRYFSINDNRSNYFYGLLLLHLPFKTESELLQKLQNDEKAPVQYYPKEKSDLAFFEKRHLLRPFSNNCTVEEYLEVSSELQDAIRQMEILMDGSCSQDDIDDQFRTSASEIVDGNDSQVDQNIAPPGKLNPDQEKLYKLVQEYLNADNRRENPSQILTFTTGSAGTGKSFLIAQIIKIVKAYYQISYPNSRVIYVTAPTGIAAKLINGQTLHAALSLGIEHGEVSKYKPLTGNYLTQKRKLWENVKFLIIDEISMVSYEMFKNIDLRLKEIMNNYDQPFGGINILVFGDLMQLPPVLGNFIYERPSYTAELHLWRLFDFCELRQNMRQQNDQPFVELLNALRIGKLTHEHRRMLMQRIESKTLKRTGEFDDILATLIAPVNSTVKAHNEAVLQKLIAKNRENDDEKKRYQNSNYQGYYIIRAIDELQSKINAPDWEKYIPKEDNKCAGVPKELKLAVGARVMLRRNIDVSAGLVNGSLGVIKRFNWGGCFLKDQSESGDLPESVTVTFDGIGDKDIKPQRCEFNANGGHGKVDRLQIPLILAWAVTAHKMQGVTVEKAVVDLGPQVFASGQAYVTLSRAKNLEKVIILQNFDITKLGKEKVNTKAIREMNRLRNLELVESTTLIQPRTPSDPRKKIN